MICDLVKGEDPDRPVIRMTCCDCDQALDDQALCALCVNALCTDRDRLYDALCEMVRQTLAGGLPDRKALEGALTALNAQTERYTLAAAAACPPHALTAEEQERCKTILAYYTRIAEKSATVFMRGCATMGCGREALEPYDYCAPCLEPSQCDEEHR